MNKIVRALSSPVRIGASACPHDCPSTCALEVELLDARTIGRVRGAEDNAYTAGVICEKVARYAERLHHPDRLLHTAYAARERRAPELCARSPGMTRWTSWPRGFCSAEQRHGAEAVWPYYYAGTMGLVHARRHQPPSPCQEIFRHLRHLLRHPAWAGYLRRHRPDRRPRSARDGKVRSRRHLGHQSRLTPRSM